MDRLYQLFSYYTPEEIKSREEIRLFIKDEEHRLRVSEFTPQTTLNEYVRKHLYLTGTKYMCREGGCGVCIVAATAKHPVTKKYVTFTVNSCLVSLFSCHDWKITTVEGVSEKNPEKPDVPIYNKSQEALVQFSGTQCGFCSPGMVMSMYAMLKEKKNVTMKEIENSFAGNICRCTGYRPILAAFKSLASDVDKSLLGNYPDIEDTIPCRIIGECKKECEHPCNIEDFLCFCLDLGDEKWYKVYKISEIVQLFKMYPQASYMLVSGNTAKGVYTNPPKKDIYIDIASVEELLTHSLTNEKLELGANMTLNQIMELFYKIGAENNSFSYLSKMADHIDLIATIPVRNVGSVAGNLTIKHGHHEFPSDMFLILETVGATLTIVDNALKETIVTLTEFITMDMTQKIISKITLRALNENHKYESYKIMPRAQNAHALVNAGFLLQFDNEEVISASIVYGCINPTFIHAKTTEDFLKSKNIFNNSTLQEAFKILEGELKADHVLPDPSPEFRQKLAIALFYKYVLSIVPNKYLSPKNKSGGQRLERPISKGTQDFDTNQSLYPLTQPIPKLEAYAQVSGRAEYIMDIPDRPGQLYGALVLAKAKPYSTITSINKDEALKLPGVVAYFDKDDLPGRNSFTGYFPVGEELFCSGTVKYYGQPIGIVVAEKQDIAEKGIELIKIEYSDSGTQPLFTTREVLEKKDTSRLTLGEVIKPSRKGTDVKHVVKGSYQSGLQYHYHMETHCCSVVPVEDGLDVFPTTQYMDLIQSSIAENLKLDANKINVSVRRLGGAYGAKISRNGLFTNAAALAAYKLQKPVKFWAPFPTNMDVVGKRCPLTGNYEAGINNEGVIQYLNLTYYSDYGSEGGNEPMLGEILELVRTGYVNDTYSITPYSVKTDTPTNTWCRAPGTTEGLGLIENIYEHISYAANIDPIKLRLVNIDQTQHPKLYKFCKQLIDEEDIYGRKTMIANFNKENRWRKKGMAVVPMAYAFTPFGNWNVLVCIYHLDGSVAISHGGIEMGQGINTKVAQVCAHAFGIPLDKVKIKPSNSLVAANSIMTGGSGTSEAVCHAVLKATDILKDRMKAAQAKLVDPTWLQIVAECYRQNISLSVQYQFDPKEVNSYMIYCVCATEIEIDILTGLHQITRVDLWEDTGNSMSPLVDIGQVEGAFIMGQGLWTTEEIIIGDKGQNLSNRTWTYKPPGVKDIPIDFRVKFPKNNPNPLGTLNSKATAEPPLCLTCVIPLAIRNAVASAREEIGNDVEKWYSLDGPSTVENTFLNSLHNYEQYVL